jgi:hypothetical protein
MLGAFSLSRRITPLPACLTCTKDFPEATRGGRTQKFCSSPCRVIAGNSRRATTRKGRALGPTNPHAGEPSGQPVAPEAITIPPSVDMAASDAPASRLDVLMAKAHSRGGIDAWEIAELAKLRGISPWAPLAKIIAR